MCRLNGEAELLDMQGAELGSNKKCIHREEEVRDNSAELFKYTASRMRSSRCANAVSSRSVC